MKPDIHLDIPLSFARPVSPGCPTDSILVPRESASPWSTTAERPPRTSISRASSWRSLDSDTGPPPSSVWRVEPASYIAFAIDTAAVAAQFPADSAAHAAIRAFAARRYVGLVGASYGYQDDAGALVEDLTVHFVARAPPPPVAGADAHWLPIAPCDSAPARPPAAAPLAPARMFPWKDRVQWTTLGTRLLMTALHESSLRFALPEDEFARFEDRAAAHFAEIPPDEDPASPIARLRMPQYQVPACVWRDIREADVHADPAMFVDELEQMDR